MGAFTDLVEGPKIRPLADLVVAEKPERPGIDSEMLRAAKVATSDVPLPEAPRPNVIIEPSRQYKSWLDELGRSYAAGTVNAVGAMVGSLAEAMRRSTGGAGFGATGFFEQPQYKVPRERVADRVDQVAQDLWESTQGPAFVAGRGGGWRGFVAQAIGQALPYMLASTAASVVTGSPAGAFFVAFAVEGDNAYRRAIAKGATRDEANTERVIVGSINGAIEPLQVGQVFRFAKAGKGSVKAIVKAATNKTFKKLARQTGRVAVDTVRLAASEALEEALQETVGITARKIHREKLPGLKEFAKQVGQAALGGGIVGTFLGGGGRVMTRALAKAPTVKPRPIGAVTKKLKPIEFTPTKDPLGGIGYGQTLNSLPAVKPGHIRLYRAHSKTVRTPTTAADIAEFGKEDVGIGGWFTNDLGLALKFYEDAFHDIPTQRRMTYIDVPKSVAQKHFKRNIEGTTDEYYFPELRRPLADLVPEAPAKPPVAPPVAKPRAKPIKVAPKAKPAPIAKPKIPVRKKTYTSVPDKWRKVGILYDWGEKGLRPIGAQPRGGVGIKIDGAKRKTFAWRAEFEELPVGTPLKTLKAIKARTDEVFEVKERRGKFWTTRYRLVPKKVVAEVKAELGEEVFKVLPAKRIVTKRPKGLFAQPVFEAISGKQLTLGIGKGEMKPEALRAVPIKESLRKKVAAAFNLRPSEQPKSPEELYTKGLAGITEFFNNPDNPMPEVRTAWNEAVKGGLLLDIKGKPGMVNIEPVVKAHKTFMNILEPAKAVERKLGKEVYATVVKGIHRTDVARLEFNEQELETQDKSFGQLADWFGQFSNADLDNFMITRGHELEGRARQLQKRAFATLPKELKDQKLRRSVDQMAEFNYKYLQTVVGDDINKMKDYFYGIYKEPKKVNKFLDYWKSTKRYTKQKVFPTYGDARAYGLEVKDPNPVNNLLSEYQAIAHYDGMLKMKEGLMRSGEKRFIFKKEDAPIEFDKVYDWTFNDVRVEPELARLINSLIAKNKITGQPVANTIRQVNNFLRTIKFIGSAFHLLSVAKQSVADSGYLGFWKIAVPFKRPGKFIPFGLRKGTAIQGITFGFRKNDPIFKTPEYRDYIAHGGGHRYSVESEAARVFMRTVDSLNKDFGKVVKAGVLPLRIPTGFVRWMFNSYIPKVKYAKYLDVVTEREGKLGRSLKSQEKIDIIKEQQNFYGMMNERLFGRSGTVTTAMRFWFMAPGYAEGNYRTMLKAATQWGFGKEGFNAARSRSNMVNSWILTAALATTGTMILTGKPPKKPETLDDMRDLFKVDTGKIDQKGRRIMIDLMTYDKDYWNVAFNMLTLRPGKALELSVKRIGGMKAPTAEMIWDLGGIALGKAVFDWKEDRVYYLTDPFLLKVIKVARHWTKKIAPISMSVYKQSRRREIDRLTAAVEMLLGLRPTKTEADKREQEIRKELWSLGSQREEISYSIGKSYDPIADVRKFNNIVKQITQSPLMSPGLKKEWEPKLLIDEKKVVYWKRFPVEKMTIGQMRQAIRRRTYKREYTRPDGRTYPQGYPHKGWEERIGELKTELKRRARARAK